jgi:membrane associated rhomboid family serine protease
MFNTTGRGPRWLDKLERKMGWLGVPNIAVLFVTLQALGFFMVSTNPMWRETLALYPDRVMAGEFWRVVTFLALPVTTSLLWVIFSLWFLYFILNAIENEWGDFRTTVYVLVSILVTIAFSFAFDFPIMDVSDFQSSLFLAAATLFPEYEINLYMVFPVKMKWMGWLSLAYVGYRFIGYGLLGKLYLIAIYSNYLVFFGPAMVASARQYARRKKFERDNRK